MLRNFFITLLAVTTLQNIHCQSPLITNTMNRDVTTLNGKWRYIVDPYENGFYSYRFQPFDEMENSWGGGYYLDRKAADKSELIEYNFDEAQTLLVPGDWNTQDEKLFYYEGSVWYRKKFDYTKKESSNRIFIYFGAANYRADVYLNGKKLGIHIGGFTPFNFEVSELIKEKDNSLVLKIDNKRLKEGVPTLNTDWWNYGGITRDVKIIEVPGVFIRDYLIQLGSGQSDKIEGFVQLDGADVANRKIEVSIPELGVKSDFITDNSGQALIKLNIRKLSLWSPENPRLYAVQLKSDNDLINDKIGFRTISVSGTDILLNGKPVFLKGICIHEENPIRGNRAFNPEDARMLLGWVKELNGNFARLAHYPHNEYMARTADEMGILLWEEIPVYWTIDWENGKTLENAGEQLTSVITRDKNRASVIIWSVGNETPVNEERLEFMTSLVAKAKNLDNTRLVSAALEQHGLEDNPLTRVITDPLADYVDILSFNEYIGWYDGLPEKCSKVTWKIEINKPVIISEFGAGALQGYHGDSLTRWSEEYQEELYKQSLDMLSKIPQLRGLTPWILADFRSPRRMLPNIQDGWNRKGIISQTGNRKKAFYVLQNYYSNITRDNSSKKNPDKN